MDRTPRSAVEAALGARVTDARRVTGGSIAEAFRVALDDGRIVFAKTARGAPPEMFPEEARGLTALAGGGPPVPEVLHVGAEVLVLAWIEPGRLDDAGAARLGEALATLHRRTAPRHGFDADNYLGATRQPNPWTEDGVAFFAEQRLGFQARLAVDRGRLDLAALRQVEALMARLPDLLPGSEPASLLHGDLWVGNVFARADGTGCLVDPAAHYGFREADLAMTRLFGSLPPAFYDAYQAAWPLPDGATGRVDLFNLYHLLNHLNLFGGAYRAQVEGVLGAYA